MDDAGIYARESPRLERAVQIGVAGGRVISVSFPRDLDSGLPADHPVLDRIEEYVEGDREHFEDVTVALTMATDRRAVLEALQSVPYGDSVTVERLARMTPRLDTGAADDLETVRRALAENPAPLLLPDHRVHDGARAAPAEVVERLRAIEGLE